MAEIFQSPLVESEIARKEAEKVTKQVMAVNIKTDADLESAVNVLSQVKTTLKGIQTKKDAIIRPLNVSIREIRELFADTEKRLTSAEADLKRAILDYQRKVEQKAAKKAEKIEEKVNAGEMTLNEGINKMGKINRVENNVKTESGAGVQFRVIRKVRIVNTLEIPAAYFMDVRVQEALRLAVSRDALAGSVIPGVEVYEEKAVAGV